MHCHALPTYCGRFSLVRPSSPLPFAPKLSKDGVGHPPHIYYREDEERAGRRRPVVTERIQCVRQSVCPSVSVSVSQCVRQSVSVSVSQCVRQVSVSVSVPVSECVSQSVCRRGAARVGCRRRTQKEIAFLPTRPAA